MDVDPEIQVGEGPVVDHEQRRRLLATVLPARIAPRFDGAHEALFEVFAGIRGEGLLHGVEEMRAGEVVAEHDEVVADTVPRPAAIHLARTRRREAVGIDDAELAILRVRVTLHQLVDDARRFVAQLEQAERHVAEARIGNGHDGHGTQPGPGM